jgi:hypothetical protein
VFERMSLNSKLIGVPFGKQSLSIGTNIKDLMTATRVLWEMAQGPALASVGLLLEGLCSTVVFSSNSTLSDLNLSGTHPLLIHSGRPNRSAFIMTVGRHLDSKKPNISAVPDRLGSVARMLGK